MNTWRSSRKGCDCAVNFSHITAILMSFVGGLASIQDDLSTGVTFYISWCHFVKMGVVCDFVFISQPFWRVWRFWNVSTEISSALPLKECCIVSQSGCEMLFFAYSYHSQLWRAMRYLLASMRPWNQSGYITYNGNNRYFTVIVKWYILNGCKWENSDPVKVNCVPELLTRWLGLTKWLWCAVFPVISQPALMSLDTFLEQHIQQSSSILNIYYVL